MDRIQKEQLVASLNNDFSASGLLIVAHYKGLTVAEITELRNKMRENGASFRVAKNSLAKLAVKGTSYESLTDLFTGPIAVAYSGDPVSAAKGLVDFANDNENLVIIGGAMGENTVDVNGIKALAKLPSLDELRGKIIGMLNTPATRIAGVLQAPAAQLARVLNAYAQKAEQ